MNKSGIFLRTGKKLEIDATKGVHPVFIETEFQAYKLSGLKRNPRCSFERTLRPGQEFRFKASPNVLLDGTHRNAWAIICDRIPCQKLSCSQQTEKM